MMEEQSRRHGAVTVGWSGQRGRRAMSKLGITLVVVTGACTQPEGQVAREGRALSVSQEGPASPPGPVAQEKLVALVVGNGDYEDTRVLKDLSNPANDARDIAEVLERLDFRVTTKVNASYAEFREALRQFAKDSKKAAISLLFYSGHGVEVEGVNYLLPVDAELSSYDDLERDGLRLRKDVLGKMSRDGLRLVILDACRNLPELRRRMMRGTGTRALSVSNGSFGALPDIQKSKEEILVAYAAAAGEEAYDGKGQRNSPYTAALKAELMQQQDLRDVFLAVRNQVAAATNEAQVPFEYGSLRRKYFLAGRPEEPSAGGGNAGAGGGTEETERLDLERDRALWEEIKESRDPEDYAAYVRAYPRGVYVELAQRRLRKYREAWKVATAGNTLDAFLSYLRDYPEGRFAETARRNVQELADAKADDDLGDTGLHWAVKENLVEVARVLLDAGADVSARSGYEGAALSVDRNTPLHFAVMKGNADMVRMLLDAGADASAADQRGLTPLHFVDKSDIARMLLEAGASVDAEAGHGWTPLHFAAMENAAGVAQVLLEAGAAVSAQDSSMCGCTPLHHAAAYDAEEVARVLLEAGAAVDARGANGQTPLHEAAMRNAQEVARVLLEAGAVVGAKDNDGWTPFNVAADRDSADTARLLLEAGASRSEAPERPLPAGR